MKILVAFVLTATVAIALADVDQAWKEFKSKHGKKYTGKEHEAKARKNFEKSHAFIEAHNAKYAAGQVSFTVGHNDMSDMDAEEIRRTKYGSMQPTDDISFLSGGKAFDSTSVDTRQLVPTLDYSTDKCMTPVKDQLYCGSCYAFSSIGALEFHYCKKYNEYTVLSEQQIVDCPTNYATYGCGGGFPDATYKYIIQSKGVASNSSYPYTGKEGTCKYDPTMKAANMTSFVFKYTSNVTVLMKFLVAAGGPVNVIMGADVYSFQLYKSGLYDDPKCYNTMTDHAMLLVGYGTLNGRGYWKLKNSWGTQWGMNGYILIAQGEICGVTGGLRPYVYPIV